MPVTEDERTDESTNGGGHGALKAATAAAAAGAATLAVRKAMSHSGSSSRGEDDNDEDRPKRKRSGSSDLLASAGSSAWEAASGALVPLAEEAAEAAGKFLAERAPDVVRQRIVPRFIEAFNNAD
jgi:ABC-type phosphate transport system substrate-binding protein